MTNTGDEPTIEMPTPDEARLFEFLERYLNSLHSGDLASRSVLIERHPELGQFVRCIELLDRLAPDAPVRTMALADQVPAAVPSSQALPG